GRVGTVFDLADNTGSLPVAIWAKTIPQSRAKQIRDAITTRPRNRPARRLCAASLAQALRFSSRFSIGSMTHLAFGLESCGWWLLGISSVPRGPGGEDDCGRGGAERDRAGEQG